MKRFKVYSLVVAILAVIVLVIVSMRLLRQSTEQKYVFNTSSQTVIKELRELSRLETASYTIEKVIDAGTSGNQLQETLFGDRILLIAHGDVIAGFDLATLDEKAVQVDGTSLRMTLPPPQILSAHLDPSQTRVYDRKQGLLSRGDKDLESEARAEAEHGDQEGEACRHRVPAHHG